GGVKHVQRKVGCFDHWVLGQHSLKLGAVEQPFQVVGPRVGWVCGGRRGRA
ncbi:MAG: hypothetical protein RJA09_235, partial [Pseudomonadota bacterium]